MKMQKRTRWSGQESNRKIYNAVFTSLMSTQRRIGVDRIHEYRRYDSDSADHLVSIFLSDLFFMRF